MNTNKIKLKIQQLITIETLSFLIFSLAQTFQHQKKTEK